MEITDTEQMKEKRMERNEDSLRDLWDNIKSTNICIIGVPEGETEKGPEKIFEGIIAENFPKMGKETVTQVQEAQRINLTRNTTRHILIKLTKIKDKEKILKTTREKKQQITYKGSPIRLSADFSAEIPQDRKECHDTFKVMKGKNIQPKILYPARLSFRFDREIKSFTDKKKLQEFSTTKPAFQKMPKECLFYRKRKGHN